MTPAQVAINRVAGRPGVASAIVGAGSAAQLDSTMAALDAELPAEPDESSVPPRESVYRMFTPEYQGGLVSPGARVGDEPAGYHRPVRNWVEATA